MSKARIMGAGSAGSTLYNANVNLKTCGGNKKQGLPFSITTATNFAHRHIKIKAIGRHRDVVFTMNQLGGVSSSPFSSSTHSYASGDGFQRMMPFICDPYCKSKGLTTPAVPSVIPDNVEALVTVPHNTIFTYCFYDGFVHCYTDATLAKSTIDFKKAKVGNQSIQDYLLTNFPVTTVNIDNIAKQFEDALAVEDMTNGDKPLLKEDRVVDGLYYSTPNMTGFPRGTSLCSKLYSAMALSYPENVNTCPQRQPILKVGDEFVFSGTFLYGSTERTINFSIRIV
jgi:hypothetical protein